MPGQSFQSEAIGTTWNIELFDDVTAEQLLVVRQQVIERIDSFDQTYSRFRKDSLVTRMSQFKGRYELPHDSALLIKLYEQLYQSTDGAVTPLIGQTLSDAGYDAAYSLQPRQVTAPPGWDEVLVFEAPQLTLKQPALLDFGAAGKGYLVDLVSEVLIECGLQNYCINAGGDMLYKTNGTAKLDIGLEHPADTTLAIGSVQLLNQSICGSAGNRRAWSSYHHIISPHSLQSPQHIAGLWVVADSGIVADGLATALYFTTPERLQSQFDFEYAIVGADMSLTHSANFPATFYTAGQA